MTAQFDVYEDNEGLYRFQLKAGNGAVMAESRPYHTIADARAGMSAVQRAAAEAVVPDDDADVVVQTGIHMHFAMWPPE